MNPIKVWLIAIVLLYTFWRLLVKGHVINWYCLLLALPGIFFDVFHHVWLSIAEPIRERRRRKREIKLDEWERMLS